MGVEITLAGLLTVRGDDGVPRHLDSAQARVAFARLLLERDRGTTRDGLADVIWPDQLPPTWASALRSVVSRLRCFVLSALPFVEQPLVAVGGRYQLRLPDDVVVDVELAERAIMAAQDALAVGDHEAARRLACDGADRLRAPFLPDHDGPWATSWRDRLSELLVTGLETASQSAAALGDTTRALVLADDATTLAPLRESTYRCRMAAHAAAGNRGEALRTYQRLRRLLADELGVDPSPETEAAYLELLGAAPSSLAVTRPLPRAGRRHDMSVPFVDREVEMALVAAAWAGTLRRKHQMLFVSGEAGVGKTRLVKEASQRIAADGGLVLFGRCDHESLIPYQPFVEALDGYVAATPIEELSALSPATRRELAAVLPSVDGPRPLDGLVRAKVFGAVTELIAHATREHPVLMLLDNLQWADRDTLWLLRHVLRHSDDSRLLVIGTARDDVKVATPLAEVVHGLERDGLVSRLPLAGLDPAAIRDLAERVLPGIHDAAALAEWLHSETAGNPFMVVELLRTHVTLEAVTDTPLPIPREILDLVSTKLGAAPNADVERLLVAAAVAGTSFELDVAAQAAGLEFTAALDALDSALMAGLVVEADTERGLTTSAPEYRFRHKIAGRALSGQLSGARRHHLRTRVAEATEVRQLAPTLPA